MQVIFLRNKNYNNGQAKRKLIDFPSLKWAWAIEKCNVEKFREVYYDVQFEEIDPEGKYIYALNWKDVDNYVTGKSDKIPKIEEFDELKYCVKKTQRLATDHCGEPLWYYDYFETPYVVIISPYIITEDGYKLAIQHSNYDPEFVEYYLKRRNEWMEVK